jgi:hypothetical protein
MAVSRSPASAKAAAAANPHPIRDIPLADITTDTNETTDAGNVSILAARLSGWSAVVSRICPNFFCARGWA